MAFSNQSAEQDLASKSNAAVRTPQEAHDYDQAFNWAGLPTEIKVMVLEEAINNASKPATTKSVHYAFPVDGEDSEGEDSENRTAHTTDLAFSNETILRQTSKEISDIIDEFRIVDRTPLKFQLTFVRGLRRDSYGSEHQRLTWTHLPCQISQQPELLAGRTYESLTIDCKLPPRRFKELHTKKRSDIELWYGDFDIEWRHESEYDPICDQCILDILLKNHTYSALDFARSDFWGHRKKTQETVSDTRSAKFKNLIFNIEEFPFPDLKDYGIGSEPSSWDLQEHHPAIIRLFFRFALRWETWKIQDTLTLRFENIEFKAKVNTLEDENFKIWVTKNGEELKLPSEPDASTSSIA
ncbi:hypothetical protein BT63DRAFT_453211 [Microthyrium microscopicum]|uniref:Uncharacterized protein n=1 Tax=Microthyrium microscopicum TaxID=703497 RepID=A0A6A6UGP6_9PEZI|nr:hypothetical protein BT63DRAFT_453211 [Microthyrium microscopicum]